MKSCEAMINDWEIALRIALKENDADKIEEIESIIDWLENEKLNQSNY